MTEEQRVNDKSKRRSKVTLPALSVDITLNTIFAQRVYNRVWDRLKGDIFTLTVRSRAAGREDIADTSENLLKEQFEKIQKDLSGDITRADHLMDEVGITELGHYDGAMRISAEFTTPQARVYLNLILAMDQLLMRLDALWLNGEIETSSCKDRSYEWQRRLFKAANRLRQASTSGKKTLEQAQEARNRNNERKTTGTETAASEEAATHEEVPEEEAGASEDERNGMATTEPSAVVASA